MGLHLFGHYYPLLPGPWYILASVVVFTILAILAKMSGE